MLYVFAKRLGIKKVLYCIWDAAVMNACMFPIIMAGTIFSRFVTITRLADGLAGLIASANLPAMVVFLLIVVFYIFCGCVMDIGSIIIITVPIVFPLLTGLGFDPYVMCITLVFMCAVAAITPPIGMGVFTVSSALKIDPGIVFKGVIPSFVAEMICVLLMGFFPQIIQFLPSLLGF